MARAGPPKPSIRSNSGWASARSASQAASAVNFWVCSAVTTIAGWWAENRGQRHGWRHGRTRPTVPIDAGSGLTNRAGRGQAGPCLTDEAHRPLPERRPYVSRYAGARTLQQRSLRHTSQVESSYLLCSGPTQLLAHNKSALTND
jgi:hypothetical protein